MNGFTAALGVASLIAIACHADDNDPASPPGQDLSALTLEQLMHVQVETAALHPQSLQDAPASVTIITAENIRKYGYRTLGEALASVRGFYVSNDRTYTTVGVRGFSLPGDYTSHILFMVNGHNMADNVFDIMIFFGTDSPVEMNLVKQIEIIRGPASALYGSNAIFATINILTKSPAEAGPLSATASTGSFGEKKIQIVETASLGGARMLLSASVYNNSGQSPVFFPGLDTPQTNHGNAIDMAGERGYSFFSTLVLGNWTITANALGHIQTQPVSWGGTIFNDRGTQTNDKRNYIDAIYARQVAGGALQWRTYYDSYYYDGRYDYPLENGVEDNHERALGDWVGSQLTYRLRPSRAGDITVGIEGKVDIRNLQTSVDTNPVPRQYLRTGDPDRSLGVIFQDEKKLSERWRMDLGIRFDETRYSQGFLSPRAALIYQPSDWAFKLLYGRSFRNPSAFQLFYGDGLAATANPGARPEWADTAEVDVERKLGKRMNLLTAAYGYNLHDYLLGVDLPNGLLQYRNTPKIQAKGVELEINGRPTDWLEATASYALQRTRDYGTGGPLSNSPNHVAKLRLAVPLARKFDLTSGMQYESSRGTLANSWVKPVYLADFTLASRRLLPNFDFRIGLRNAFNLKYSDPIALYALVPAMPQPGRSFFVELIAHRAE